MKKIFFNLILLGTLLMSTLISAQVVLTALEAPSNNSNNNDGGDNNGGGNGGGGTYWTCPQAGLSYDGSLISSSYHKGDWVWTSTCVRSERMYYRQGVIYRTTPHFVMNDSTNRACYEYKTETTYEPMEFEWRIDSTCLG